MINEIRQLVIKLVQYVIELYLDSSKDYAIEFETELYDTLSLNEYLTIITSLSSILQTQYGYFPDEVLIMKYINKELTLIQVLNYTKNITPRDNIIRLFISAIYKYTDVYNLDKPQILQLAKDIEKSCYNSVIKNCKKLEDPPCRKWTSQLFLTMYSTKCGIIYNLLNPDSMSNELYNSSLLDNILSNKIDVREIGDKSEKELCPKSIEQEKKQIELRSEQHVKEKESNLFRCPKCKERRVTYREVQLRALDEAPDYSCKCLNCGTRFKGKY